MLFYSVWNISQRMKECIHRFYRVEKSQIAYLRFIVESYEGLAQISSLPGRAEVEWTIPWDLKTQAEQLAKELAKEIMLLPIEKDE